MGRFERPFCLGGGAVVHTSHGALGDILLAEGVELCSGMFHECPKINIVCVGRVELYGMCSTNLANFAMGISGA